jgi:hypothetical protein
VIRELVAGRLDLASYQRAGAAAPAPAPKPNKKKNRAEPVE